jgi:Ca-activated chloride channel family protein
MTSHAEPEANQTPCERAEPLLSAYLLEEISGGEREAVADHLAACEHCRDELDMLRGAASVLRSIPPLEAGLEPEGRERILAEARESAAASRGGSRRLFYLAAAGLAAAAVLAVALFPGLIPVGAPRKEAGIQVADVAPADLSRAPEALLTAQAVPPAPTAGVAPAPVDPKELVALHEVDTLAEGDRLSLTVDEAKKMDAFFVQRTTELESRVAGFEPAETETGKRLVEQLAVTEVARADSSRTEGLLGTEASEARAASPEALREAERLLLVTRTEERGSRGASASAAGGYGQRWGKRSTAGEPEGAGPVSVAPNGTAQTPDLAMQLPADRARRYAADGGQGLAAGARPAPGATPAVPAPAAEPAGLSVGEPTAGAAGQEPAEVALTDHALEKIQEFAPGLGPKQFGRTPAGDGKDPAALPDGGQPDPNGVSPGYEFGGAGPAVATTADKPAQAPPAAGATVAAPITPAPGPDPWKARAEDILTRLDRRPGETPAMMFFRYWGTNPFVEASSDPLSTFAVDVDTASYTIARAYLYERGILPPREAIRTEEFINFFKSRLAPPAADGPVFAVHAEMAPSPFAHEPDYQILKVGLKGREVGKEKRKACALVFVIDTSGSMRQGNRLELVKEALRLLVPELDEGDTVGIVAFDREARVILDPVTASERERILDAISRLEPRQNTNVGAGLEMGYQMAVRHKLAGGSNRVLLLSDGVANTGTVDANAITEKVRAEREQGIYLTCVGVGMGNMNDSLMETLADRGNGQCIYVDRIEQARKAFVDNLTGTLEAIAKDAKIQVEFDPAKVIRYRLLGYENRAVADADFRNNKVDAGEVGAGHEVTALYELKVKPDAGDTLATIRVRYLTVDHGEAVEIARTVTPADRRKSFAEASPRFQVSAAAAELAEVLRGSYWARGNTLDRVAAILEPILGAPDGPSGARLGDDNDVVELVALARKADALVREREAAADDVARTQDALRENYILRARVEDALRERTIENQAQLDEILRQNEALRRRLEELLRG